MKKFDEAMVFRAECRKLSLVDTALSGRRTTVRLITGDDIAYTQQAKRNAAAVISINIWHVLFEKLSTADKRRIMRGLNLHELGHQRFTDFDFHEKMMKILETGNIIHLKKIEEEVGIKLPEVDHEYTKTETKLYHSIWNAVEDPAIEFQTYRHTGGEMPDDLRYTVYFTYREAVPIDHEEEDGKLTFSTPFAQVNMALINYGDIGLLKGRFTFPEAREAFLDILPIFNEAIEIPNAHLREALAFTIFEKLRPLFQEIVDRQKAFDEFMKAMKKYVEDHKDSCGKGTNSANADAEPSDGTGDEETEARRKQTLEMTRKEFEELKKNAGKSGGKGSGKSVTIKITDEDGEEGKGEGKEDEGKGESEDASEGKSEEKSENAAESGNSSSPSESSNESSESSENSPHNPKRLEMTDMEGSDWESIRDEMAARAEDNWEQMQLTPEELEKVEKDIEREVAEEKKAIEKEKNSDTNVPNFTDITGQGFTSARCNNIIEEGDESASASYDAVVGTMRADILRLAGQLKRATKRPFTEKVKKDNGILNIERYTQISVRRSVKVFDKRRDPKANDIAVFINIDESGSMCGNRIAQAKQCAIGIAEACSIAKIPVYVMGFSADIGGYDANHWHYIRWKNTRSERLALMGIRARSNNFDGYSLRYASRILKKRSEAHKLLVVISDGQPAASSYRGHSNIGVADVKDAVRQATADGLVVHGIGIGSEGEKLREMYGVNYTQNDELTDLFRDFGAAILRQLKND